MAMANKWLQWLSLSAIVAAWYSEAHSAVNIFHISETGVSPAHNGQVCSTWGNFHYKTFDGDIFQLHSTCNYILTSSCHSTYNDFNIQIRRQEAGGSSTIKNIILNLQGSVVELSKGSVTIDGELAILPVSRAGVLIEKTSTYIKIKAKLGLVAFWNEEDSFLVELDQKFKNQTCGLCGDFNGVQLHDEFYSHGVKLSLRDFADFWKMNGPTEACSDYTVEPTKSCDNLKPVCEQILMGPAFSSCHNLLDITSFTSACVADLCHCASSEGEKADPLCLCNTVSEFSRQCVHAGGKPQNWRTEELCWKSCQYQMEYKECGSPCADTCSNPDASLTCDSHCMDGCFCPAGTVFDDLNRRGCVPLSECSCSYNSKTYGPGESYSSNCKKCVCNSGQWECQEEDCPGTCSVEGGAHIKSFDGKFYTFHGDCSYVLAKDCSGTQFVIQGELVQCGMTESETCLKSVTLGLSGGANVITIQPNGKVYVNGIYAELPFSAAGISAFRASSYYLLVQTSVGALLEVQLEPVMQLYITVTSDHQANTCGLCGNFNSNQADDFLKLSGVTDATAAGFANSWKTHAGCPDVKSSFKNPCSLSVDNENYAQHWCSMLTDLQGVFSSCHSEISPDSYKENCMYDSCNCEKSEDFMCAAVSSYVHACAAAGIQISDWRKVICGKYASSCPSGMVYSYNITSSSRTCRCIGSTDLSCHSFPPIDGCICAEGTYMDDSGKCVPSEACPCYNEGSAVPAGQVINKEGVMCTCTEGRLSCIGEFIAQPSCAPPMVFFNCSANGPAAKGTECEKSCSTLDMACVSTGCVSGCMCASGLVSDGNGGCIEPGNCSCVHNGISYQPGETTKVDCNTCTCNGRTWQCTTNQCDGTCYVYGDGHYITFDQNRFTFDGSCEYILTQDYCGSAQSNGTFRVITENVPCGTTGTTCSKTIKIFLGNAELILTDGSYQLLSSGAAEAAPFQYSTMGNYLVVEANNGLILMWDKKTTLFIKLSPKYKGHVCGLCGNYDGSANNDLTTRSNAVVVNPLVFGNSWKDLSSCPNAQNITSPCTSNPYRQSWAQKQCSIIQSDVFSACHSSVDPVPYYDACVFDSCACDTGGDCECFCTAVAAYAESCNQAGVCVQWRTPNICPVFCDYYNPPDECEWHYMPCGSPCMKTCRNPSSNCSTQIPPLEGCYPKCPPAVPYFDEDTMTCVSKEQCGCYNAEGIHYNNGDKVPATENCYTCVCNSTTLQCHYDAEACICTYNGKKYPTGSTLDNMTDGNGNCITAVCGINGTIIKLPYSCTTTTVTTRITTQPTTTTTITATPTTTTTQPPTTTTITTTPTATQPPTTTATTTTPTTTTQPPTTTPTTTTPTTTETTSTTQPATTTTTTTTPTTTMTTQPTTTCPGGHDVACDWSNWINLGSPTPGPDGGQNDTIQNIISAGYHICSSPEEVQCRAVLYPELSMSQVGQAVTCNKDVGLICINKQQGLQQKCFDYEIRFKCCGCPTTHVPTTTPTTTTPSTTETTTTTHLPSTTTAISSTNPATTSELNPVTGGTSTPVTKPLICHCLHNGTTFHPGSVVYTETVSDGYCQTGYCNETCHVVVKRHVCECVGVHPPRKDGESWMVSNCTTGTCTNGTVNYTNTPCPPLKPVVCANNFPAIKVTDPNDCCPHYECQCICYGWGDPHYVTFDGTYYGFQGNCSYWLVKEILPKYNFNVMINNSYCGAADGLSCPQSITVFYDSFKIFITQKDINGIFTNQVLVNNKPINPAYQYGDFRVTTTGIDTVLVIGAIQAKITFSGLIFSIYLPYNLFAGNTEGQCGTCDNNRTDDCRLPDGKIDPSCPNMARQWHTNDSSCDQPSPPPTTPAPDTCNATLCNIIKSSVFEACHNIINYNPFVTGCEFDMCHSRISWTGCTSLQAYADACAEAGVCIEWRNATKGLCEYSCPSPKAYQACGPLVEPTCDLWYNQKFIYAVNVFTAMTNVTTEGCFCPNGTILLSSGSYECVPTCEICRLANGKWAKANTTWIEGCKECTCEEDTLQVSCSPISCPTQQTPRCDQEGQIKVKVNYTDGCCLMEKCVCDVTQCSGSVPSCPVGYALKTTMGACCVNYSCVPKPDVCVFNNQEYQVGDLVPMKPCEKCICSNQTDASSHLHIVECYSIPCDTNCPLGYEYQNNSGHCCGNCVQTSCIITLPNNVTQTLKPGNIWTPDGNGCVTFECLHIANQYITIEAKTICPPYDINNCIPGTETIAPGGCCPICIPKNNPCNVTTTPVYVENQGCKSGQLVNITSCSGACGTSTFYSAEMSSLQHTCSCCQELATSERQIQLSCPDSTEVTYTYTHIDACGCLKTECSAPGNGAMTSPASSKPHRRKR